MWATFSLKSQIDLDFLFKCSQKILTESLKLILQVRNRRT